MFYRHEATIRCSGEFPISMFWQDCCYPHGLTDAMAIEKSLREPVREPFTVRLGALIDFKICWSRERWKAFGCEIIETSCTEVEG